MDWPDFYSTYPAWTDGNTMPGYDNYGTGLRLAAGDRSYVLGPANSDRGRVMPSLADMLMPPTNRQGRVGQTDAMHQMIQQHPMDAYGNVTGVNPYMEDPRQTTPQMLNNYAPNRIPAGQQDQMSRARQFANMYKFAMTARNERDKLARLAAGISEIGITPPTLGELYGPDAATSMSPQEAQMSISPEDWAKLMMRDQTGEVFNDALSRIR